MSILTSTIGSLVTWSLSLKCFKIINMYIGIIKNAHSTERYSMKNASPPILSFLPTPLPRKTSLRVWCISFQIFCKVNYFVCVCVNMRACSVAKWCPTLYDLMDCGLPGFSVLGFPRQEYCSGLPFPSPGDLPDPAIKPVTPVVAGIFFTTESPGKPHIYYSLPLNIWFFVYLLTWI